MLNNLSAPFFGIGLHVLVAIFFAVHAVRRGQNLYWLIILFMFPMLGSIVYFFVVYLPEMRGSRGLQVAKNTLINIVDPSRELREAREAFDITPTVGNRLRLAAALLESGAAQEALEQYRQAAQGPFENDPALLAGMAQAQMATHAPADTARTLEKLFGTSPLQRQQPALALLYARSLAEIGAPNTREAFESAMRVANGPDTKCFYADWLVRHGAAEDKTTARSYYEEVVSDSRHWHEHARHVNREWLRHAKEALALLENR